jgi:hypothetical protein
MACSTKNGPRIPFYAMRQVNGLREPMRTRAMFYLEQLAKQKTDDGDLTITDLNLAIGRAYRDRCDDATVQVDHEALAKIVKDAETGKGFRPLRELVDAVSGGDS